MKRTRSVGARVVAVGWMLWVTGAGWCGQAQGRSQPQTPLGQTGTSSAPTTNPATDLPVDEGMRGRMAHMEEDQVKARNMERQKKLVADTERLLSLATELKGDVDKTNKDMMSVDVIKKAEEIEKLARSVKDRMRGS